MVVPARFNALTFWRMVRDHGVTWYSAVPTIHQLILTRKRAGEDATALRALVQRRLGAGPDAPHGGVLRRARAGGLRHDRSVAPDGLQSTAAGARKPGSVGPGTGVRISIRDETARELPSGQAGEVCIDGPGVIREYENNPEATAKSFFGEWFRTGDQGILDDDGYLRLTGRIKELINRAGENIAPREIDEVLLAHPAVAEAVCFGVPHATWGEEVEAAVVLRPEIAGRRGRTDRFCRERLADFKCPKKIHIVGSHPAHGHREDPAAECRGGVQMSR